MNDTRPVLYLSGAILALAIVAALLIKWLMPTWEIGGGEKAVVGGGIADPAMKPGGAKDKAEEPEITPGSAGSGAGFLLAFTELLRARLEVTGALRDEAVLTFKSEADYDKFRALAASYGLRVLGDARRGLAMRVGFDDMGALAKALSENDYASPSPNYVVAIPSLPPSSEDRATQAVTGFGNSLLPWLGANGDVSQWGAGVKIAVLDSGVAAHATFRDGQVTSFDLISESGAPLPLEHSHGTAMASLVAGNDPEAPGVAPGAQILSYRVTDADGLSDTFTLTQGIYDAVDAGADIINISLGSYGDSSALASAVTYAAEHGVLVVAAAGNEGAGVLAYPARYDQALAVGAVDANAQQLDFSNSSAEVREMMVGSPGLNVRAGGLDNSLVEISGTSPAAAVTTGAIAAVMSQVPSVTNSYQALALLEQYANEAGALGTDAAFGSGVIDVGRVLQANTPGISDVAVASHYIAPITADNPNPTVQVVVENRGTASLVNVQLDVNAGALPQQYNIGSLAPGQATAVTLPSNLLNVGADGQISVTSSVSLPGNIREVRTDNNGLSTTTVPVTPEVPAE